MAGQGDGGRREQKRVGDATHGSLLGQRGAGSSLRGDEGGDGIRGALDHVLEPLLKPRIEVSAIRMSAIVGMGDGSAAAVVARPVLVTFV